LSLLIVFPFWRWSRGRWPRLFSVVARLSPALSWHAFLAANIRLTRIATERQAMGAESECNGVMEGSGSGSNELGIFSDPKTAATSLPISLRRQNISSPQLGFVLCFGF